MLVVYFYSMVPNENVSGRDSHRAIVPTIPHREDLTRDSWYLTAGLPESFWPINRCSDQCPLECAARSGGSDLTETLLTE